MVHVNSLIGGTTEVWYGKRFALSGDGVEYGAGFPTLGDIELMKSECSVKTPNVAPVPKISWINCDVSTKHRFQRLVKDG